LQRYKIHIDEDAFDDIQSAANWYNNQQQGLGIKFTAQVKLQINSLKLHPHKCSIKYLNIRCLLVKKFPFLIHYSINENSLLVEVFAIIHTSRNPKIWLLKTNKN
jgi:ParE toxin of type II toxin-antitoxin system, parDE